MGLTRKKVPSGPPAPAGSLAEALALVPEPRRPNGWSPGRSPLTQRAICARIVANGGDYLLPVDDNQPTLRAELEEAFSPLAGPGAGRAQRPRRRPGRSALAG